jgi:hypothetical protein
MARQYYQDTLVASNADGAALSNSTTPTSLLPAQALYTLPAGYLDVGKRLRVHATGRISTVVTAPGTLTFAVRLGSVDVFSSGALALNIVAKTNVSWWLDIEMVCRAVGSGTSANFLSVGLWASEAVIGSPVPGTGGSGVLLLPASAPAVGTGFDSTAAQQLNLFGTWSVANAANSITCHQFIAESKN